MKRLLLAALLISPLPLLAQEAAAPGSLAARQESARETAERFSRLENDFEALKNDNDSLRKELARLREELSRLKDDQAKTATAVANNNPHEDLKHLAEKITEVDRKRESDKQAISEEIKRSIAKLQSDVQATLADRPVSHVREREPRTTQPSADIPEKSYIYPVASGDTLLAIVKAYNAEFKSKGLKTITTAQVKALNPNVNWDKLKAGTKITIPAPPGAKDKD